MLVGKCPFDRSLRILKLPPAPVGVSARSGRAFRRGPGLPAPIIVKQYEKQYSISIKHCLPVSVAQSFTASRLAPSPAPRGPSMLRLCCRYDPAPRPCVIRSRNTTGRAAPPFSPIAFYISSGLPGLKTDFRPRIAKKTDSRCTYIR